MFFRSKKVEIEIPGIQPKSVSGSPKIADEKLQGELVQTQLPHRPNIKYPLREPSYKVGILKQPSIPVCLLKATRPPAKSLVPPGSGPLVPSTAHFFQIK